MEAIINFFNKDFLLSDFLIKSSSENTVLLNKQCSNISRTGIAQFRAILNALCDAEISFSDSLLGFILFLKLQRK